MVHEAHVALPEAELLPGLHHAREPESEVGVVQLRSRVDRHLDGTVAEHARASDLGVGKSISLVVALGKG